MLKKPPLLKTSLLNSLSPDNPRNRLYDEAINASQKGEFDNLNKRFRFYFLTQLVTKAVAAAPHLDLVECGCWRGHSSFVISSIMRKAGCTGKLLIFDSFEGLSPFTDSDLSSFKSTPADRDKARRYFASNIDHVKSLLAPFGTAELKKGWIPEVFANHVPRELSFASIDVDLYEPTRAAIEFLYPQLRPGGIMFFDDYGYLDFPGAKKAIDEFLGKNKPSFFLEDPIGSAFLIK